MSTIMNFFRHALRLSNGPRERVKSPRATTYKFSPADLERLKAIRQPEPDGDAAKN